MIEVAAVQGRTNANLAAGYGLYRHSGAFLMARQKSARHHSRAIPAGGISASGGLLQRRLGLPDASVQVLQGIIFVSCWRATRCRPHRLPERKILIWRWIDRTLDRPACRVRRRHPQSRHRFCS